MSTHLMNAQTNSGEHVVCISHIVIAASAFGTISDVVAVVVEITSERKFEKCTRMTRMKTQRQQTQLRTEIRAPRICIEVFGRDIFAFS